MPEVADSKRLLESQRQIFRNYPQSLYDILKVIHSFNKDRIYVLQEAFDSAKQFDFEDIAGAWDLLWSLCTELHELLFRGDGGNIEKKFKDKTNFDLAIKDSKEVKENAKFMRLRKRTYSGEEVEIIPHLKLDTKGQNLRIHFYVDSDRKLIVIGHCGDHLDTPGTRRRKEN